MHIVKITQQTAKGFFAPAIAGQLMRHQEPGRPKGRVAAFRLVLKGALVAPLALFAVALPLLTWGDILAARLMGLVAIGTHGTAACDAPWGDNILAVVNC